MATGVASVVPISILISMKPPHERPISSSSRQLLIEEVATRLFARRGFAATTVDDIVAAAGLTKPMLYRHFDSKRELCVSLLECSRDELVAAPLSRFEPGSRAASSQLGSMLDAWLEHIELHPDAARLLFTPISGDHRVEQVQRELWNRQSETQVALLREFAPGLSEVEAAPLGEAIRAGLGAVALWWLDHPETPRRVPLGALLKLTEGTIAAADRKPSEV